MRIGIFSSTGAVVGLALALVGCRLPDDEFRIKGTVHFRDIEGCWLVDDGAGHTYEPVNLPNAFQVDQLRVEIIATLNKTLASYCLVGELVDIVSIEKQ